MHLNDDFAFARFQAHLEYFRRATIHLRRMRIEER
jgi:hypothetical protein